MIGNFDQVRQSFADQFEPDAQGFLYRKYMKGAPIRVSAAERDRYVATFNRYTRYASWGVIGGIMLLALFLAFYFAVAGGNVPDMAFYLGLGAIVVAFMVGHFWVWNLPARELRGRGTAGEARSSAEVRRLFLEKTTYGQIATGAGVGVALFFRIQSSGNMLSGWNLFWAGAGVVLLILSAIQAFRKWRSESQQQ